MKTQTTFRDVNVRVHASKLKFALIFAFIFSVFQSQTYTFTGNGDGTSWTDAANWTGATGIPYIDDTTCSVNVGSFTVTIPSSTNLTMESGTVSGAGKIINNGTFTVISTGSKSFTLATFENKGTFSLGNGTDNNGTINMYNNTVFDNLVGASLIANGLSFSSSGGNTVKNAGVFRKLGEFSENFNVNFTNTGEIKVEAGTLLLNGTKDLQTGVFTLAAGTTLDVSGSSGILSGIWTGTVSGTFKLDGNNSVAVDQTVTNRISGNGITFTSGNLGGSGKFINETIFSVEGTASKSFTLANFENKGTFTLGNGTDNNGTISMYNNTVFDNLAGGTLIANGLSFSSSGENMVKNAGVFRKLGEFSESFNITLINTGEIKVEAGTLGLTGNKDLRTGVFNIAQNAVLDTNNGSSTLSGNWTGNIVGKFYLNGNSSVLENQTVVNQTSGNGITFVSGSLGGSGKFINETIFSVEGTASKSFVINTFENKGTFNLGNGTDNNGTISLYNNTIFDNLAGGTLVSNGLSFSSSGGHTVNNSGVFRKLGEFIENFNITLINTGEIKVEAGTLGLTGNKDLRTGIFTIAQNAVLDTNNGSSTLSGIWTGTVSGKFYLNGNSSVLENQTVVNQIGGDGITFTTGSFGGSGTFSNESVFTAETTNSKNFMIATYDNKGIFNLGDGTNANGSIYLTNHTFNNLGTGEVLAKGLTFINNGVHMVNNAGTFRKLGNFDETFNVNVTNTGNIVGEAGRIIFSGSLNNTTTGRISGFAIGTPSGNNFTNSGILAPGLSPGELNFTGQLKLTNGILEIEIDGNTPGTEYDQITYNANTAVPLSGNVHVVLGFAPNVGDEFIIVKSQTAPITSTLAAPPFVEYNGNHYYFTITNSTNEVKLTVTEMTLATATTDIQKSNIYPNPATDVVHYSAKTNLVGFEIYNLAGQKLKSGKQLPKEGEIDVKTLMPGNYILRLIFADRTETHKLIKK